MTFGQAIKLILQINEIKMGVLANVLGYDISYLSKWVNGTKLPSAKYAETLCDTIADYVQLVSSASMQAETAARLSFSITKDTPFSRSLSDRIYTIFLEQHSPRTENIYDDNNSQLLPGWGLSPENALDELTNYYKTSHASQLEGLMALPSELLNSDFLLSANDVCAQMQNNKQMKLHQLISIKDFNGDIDKYLRYILKHLSMLSPIQLMYYSPFDDDLIPSEQPLFVLKDNLAVQGIRPFPGSSKNFSVKTHNQPLVTDTFQSYSSCFHPILLQEERLDLYNELPYSYAISQDSRGLMPYMGTLRLGEELLDDFLDKYLDVPEMYEYHRKMHLLTMNSPYSLVIYVSALIDYINTGRIRLFDGVITISKEDRQRHLQYLLNEMEQDNGVSIKILSDRNPILNRTDNRLTLYTNANATFATSDAPNARTDLFHFVSPIIKRQINTFLDHIEALPDYYIKQGTAAMDFIHGTMQLI